MRLRTFLASWLYPLIIVLVSLILFGYYTEQDMHVYEATYEGLAGRGLQDAYDFYRNAVGGGELVHFSVSYIGSTIGIPRSIVMSAVNGVVASIVGRWLVKNEVHPLVAVFLAFNYYLFVIYIPAERLKFACAFFLLAAISRKRKSLSYFLSVASHLQALLFLAPIAAARAAPVVHALLQGKLKRKQATLLAIIVSAIMVGAYLLKDQLEYKFAQYGGRSDVLDVLKPAVFLVPSLVYAGRAKWLEVSLVFLPILIAAAIVGSDRVTVVAAGAFVAYGVTRRRGLNLGMSAFIAYFTWKTVEFLVLTVDQGYAF